MMKLKTTVAVLILAMCYTASIVAQETIEKDEYIVALKCTVEYKNSPGNFCSPACAFWAEKATKKLGANHPIKVDVESGICKFRLDTDNAQSVEQVKSHFQSSETEVYKIEITRSTGTIENWQSDK